MTPTTHFLMASPAVVDLGGSILAMFWHLGREARSLIQHFAAGVVLAALAVVVATFFDVAMDVFIIGAGFAAGGTTRSILAIGLSVELLFLGFALTSASAKGRHQRGTLRRLPRFLVDQADWGKRGHQQVPMVLCVQIDGFRFGRL